MKPKAVQSFIGHETIDMTMRVYAHVFEDSDFNGEMDKIADELLCKPKKQGT
jgi:integrase